MSEPVNYPCLVFDIGTSRIPKSFDKTGDASGIEIYELLLCYLDNEGSEITEESINYFRFENDDGKIKESIPILEDLISKCTLVSHNAETDLKIIGEMYRRSGFDLDIHRLKKFCTMKNGVKYSKTHVYRGGKKIKKYPHLQELFRNITGEDVGKGDIYDDLFQCFICFKILENDTLSDPAKFT
jgi:hypothetical protein